MTAPYKVRTPPSFGQLIEFMRHHFGKQPGMVFAAYFFVAASALCSVFSSYIYAWLVDVSAMEVVGNRNFDAIMKPVLALVGVSVCIHLFERCAAFVNCYTDSRVHAQIASETMKCVHDFETEWHTNIFAGSIVTAIRRGRGAAHRLFDTFCYDIFPAIMAVTASIVIAWQKSPTIGMALVVYAAMFTAFSIAVSLKFVAPKNRIFTDEDSRLGGAVADSVTGYAAVKAAGAEAYEYERIKFAAERFAKAARTAWIRSNILSLSQNIVINIGRFAALALAAIYWVDGKFSPGDMVFVLMLQRTMADYLYGIGNRVRDIIEAINDMEEVVAWRLRKPLIDAHTTSGKKDFPLYTLKFEDMGFTYTGQGRAAISDFNLEIHPGEKVALVGRTGSGKSTLFKLLHRYYMPQKGRITIDGHDIAEADLPSLRRQLALVSQEPVLFHRSLAENIAYAKPDATIEEIKRAADMAQIAGLIETLPQGYETLVGERGVKLSGGERQRVAIARALLADARIVLLDEATSALDNETELLVQKALAELTRGRSVLAIAHRISTVQDFDRIVVMDMGRIVESGTHQELLEQKGVYARLYHRHDEEIFA